MFKWTAVVVFCAMLGIPAAILAAERNEPAIREVVSGRQTVARAAWWGYDPQDSTHALQAAIHSGAKKVIVEKMSGPWIVEPITLAANQELFFEPGTVVLAKKGSFRGGSDSLFSARGKANIKLVGPGATLQMRRADYDSPEYKKAEWRHVLNFHGCTNVTVEGLTLAESGGDGIYLGTGSKGETNRQVVIRDVICDRNYRQGISVITAEDLLIENCTLKATAGTAPAAGIDFEPNLPGERLVRCVMRRCVIENNQGYALHIYARPLNGTSAPISIRVEDCVTRGTNARSVSLVTSCGESGAVKGTIEFVRCRFEDAGRAGVVIGSKPADAVRVRFAECSLADPADRPGVSAPFVFDTRPGDLGNMGGVEFAGFTLCERVERPLFQFTDAIGARLVDISGTLVVERGERRVVHRLDQQLIDQWVPYDPINAIPKVPLAGLPRELIGDGQFPSERQLAEHRVREEATYLVHAAKDSRVAFRLAYQPVGRYEGKPLAVRVLSPTGKEVHRLSVELRTEAEDTFTATETGAFRITCRPGQNTARMAWCSHPICIVGERGLIHLLGTTGEFLFWVPAGAKEFGLRIRGEGDGERVSAEVFDATGKPRWQRADIATPQSMLIRRDAAAADELWRLRFRRPTVGVLEDCTVEFRGLPALLAIPPVAHAARVRK